MNDVPGPGAVSSGGGEAEEQEGLPRRGVLAAFLHPVSSVVSLGAVVLGLILSPYGTGPSICAFKRMTDLPCPGCGLTRSVTCILHGEFTAAWQYNPFGYGFAFFFVVLSLLIVLPMSVRRRIYDRIRPAERVAMVIGFVFLFAMLGLGLVRLVMVQSGYGPYQWWRGDEMPPVLAEHLHQAHGVEADFPLAPADPVGAEESVRIPNAGE